MTIHSKRFLANQWHLINKEWANELVGLCLNVRGGWWIGSMDEDKGFLSLHGGKIKEYNHDKRRWLIEFDNDDEDQFMQYDCVVMYTYADKDTGTFYDFKLPANPIPPSLRSSNS